MLWLPLAKERIGLRSYEWPFEKESDGTRRDRRICLKVLFLQNRACRGVCGGGAIGDVKHNQAIYATDK